MIETILVWILIIGFFSLAAYICGDDGLDYDSKAYGDLKETIFDLHQVGCEIITIGQYLQPNRNKFIVKSFVTPDQFNEFKEYGLSIGVKHMYCGPFVRSSYNAGLLKDYAFKGESFSG